MLGLKGDEFSRSISNFILRLPSPVLVVFKAAEQEGILSAVEESGVEVLGQTNAETSNIIEVIELLKKEQSREGEGDRQNSEATNRLEFLETDESMYEGRTSSSKETLYIDLSIFVCLNFAVSLHANASVELLSSYYVSTFSRASIAGRLTKPL